MEQTAPDRLREQLIASRVAANKRLSADQQRRIAYGTGVGVAVLLILLLVLSVQYTGRYAGRVYRGVSVAGVAVGGLSREEALAALNEQVASWAATPVPVRTAEGDHSWEITPQDLGVTLDTTAATEAAFAVGRDSNPLGNFVGWFGALQPFGGYELAIPATLDDNSLDLALRDWASEATYTPTNAAYKVDAGGKLMIVADVNGLGFDFDGSRAALVEHAARLEAEPVTLSQTSVPAPINAAMLGGVENQARAIAAQPLVARYNGQSWTLDQQTLANAIGYQLVDGQLTLALDPARLRPFFEQIAKAVGQPDANAQIVTTNAGKYTIVPGKEGFGLDEAATLAQINSALNSGVHEITLTVSPQVPAIVAADLEPILARLEGIVSTPVAIRIEGFRARTLVRADIMPLIRLTEQPKGPEKLLIGLDEPGLRALVGVLASEINQPVRDAKFAFANGMIEDIEKSQDGRELQVAPTLKVLNDAILGAVGSASPVITVTKPKVPSSDKAAMRTPDVLGYGSTYYGASIPTRRHNVELSTERLNGTIIPPGELFSFNEAVGAQTVENGYQEAYGIALVPGAGGGKGEVKTVNSIAGGICQVSTTLFQGVFKSGLPIEERNWHLFWVGYGDSPTGFHGLDATVDDQSDLDFRWWNNTGGWIGIEAYANGDYVEIKIYGKDPGWDVQIDGPEITNVIEPDPAPVTEKTYDLPVGQKIMIEHAADGFTSAIRRQVFDASGKLVLFNGKGMDTTFKSNYLPSRDRYQLGVPEGTPLD
jgi:vancomycin resistance protein YoaR